MFVAVVVLVDVVVVALVDVAVVVEPVDFVVVDLEEQLVEEQLVLAVV